ncbi:hypothetical protein PF005_g24632 [Phytophthora fragariae]|uniref:Uncharacterized protein n=1 Tax=Phytophthora fragariae TaxID=53985 RepID=A0A6A3WMI1_9STRA|nr:hypothetical protein PF011_g23398 [Phytophthora fragariae]KAE9177120.1 hypothetical protein PF005_g24632 [Phytophthora fragariae]KAE9187785.1 hypothetical protein PF002_g25497 [Phytophthora fragariae]
MRPSRRPSIHPPVPPATFASPSRPSGQLPSANLTYNLDKVTAFLKVMKDWDYLSMASLDVEKET